MNVSKASSMAWMWPASSSAWATCGRPTLPSPAISKTRSSVIGAPRRVERVDHLLRRARGALRGNPATRRLKGGVVVIEEQAEDVDRRARQIGAQLDRGDDPHAELRADPLRFVHAVGVVVVAQGHGRTPCAWARRTRSAGARRPSETVL